MGYSGAGGKLIHKRNQKQKISWHCPLKRDWITSCIFFFEGLLKLNHYFLDKLFLYRLHMFRTALLKRNPTWNLYFFINCTLKTSISIITGQFCSPGNEKKEKRSILNQNSHTFFIFWDCFKLFEHFHFILCIQCFYSDLNRFSYFALLLWFWPIRNLTEQYYRYQ